MLDEDGKLITYCPNCGGQLGKSHKCPVSGEPEPAAIEKKKKRVTTTTLKSKASLRFNPKATIGELYGPAMKIKTKAEADEYFEALVQWCMEVRRGEGKPCTREDAEHIQKSNLGYYSGYYDNETMVRVQKLFCCEHPIFGKAENGIPTPEEAFEMGKKLGEKQKKDSRQP